MTNGAGCVWEAVFSRMMSLLHQGVSPWSSRVTGLGILGMLDSEEPWELNKFGFTRFQYNFIQFQYQSMYQTCAVTVMKIYRVFWA